MVGAQLLARLMRRHVPVIALVRGKGAQSAEARVDAVLSRFENAWNQRLGRPAILTGDMASPRLGLSTRDEQIRPIEMSSPVLEASTPRRSQVRKLAKAVDTTEARNSPGESEISSSIHLGF